MAQLTIEAAPPGSGRENRRSARVRRVRPVAFAADGTSGRLARRTVTANISRGGMLLVTRRDHFPPAGSALTLMPYERTDDDALATVASIPGRVVYTRYSTRAELRFAGFKFESDLTDQDARLVGLDGEADPVADTIKVLESIESIAGEDDFSEPVEIVAASIEGLERGLNQIREAMERSVAAFLRSTQVFLVSWGEHQLRDIIARRHPLARAKGAAGLRLLKNEWRELCLGMPALVEAQLDRAALWPHRSIAGIDARIDADDAWFYDTRQDQPPDRIMSELRKLAGFIGRLAIRHGFEDVDPAGDWVLMSNERALVAYRGRFVISDAMRDALRNGADLQQELARLLGRVSDVRESNARAEALRLWDEA